MDTSPGPLADPAPDDPERPRELQLRYLQRARNTVLEKLAGLSEHDLRRPLTPSGTNLLGLVKHLAGVELGYFGECSGRPTGIDLPFDDDASYDQALDMYALPEESSTWVVDLYRRAWAHTDATVRELGTDAPARVPWWGERAETTVGFLLVHVLHETAQHAGHADVLRELVDGTGGRDHDELGDDTWWRAHLARVQAAADAHRSDAHR